MKTIERALVLGAGASGRAAAELLAEQGSAVVVIDAGESDALREQAAALAPRGIEVRLAAGWPEEGGFDVCVVSPGIAADSEWVRRATEAGIPVWGELELGSRHCRCPILAVTGSNGKSTLARLCGDALLLAKKRVNVGGNYGEPLSSMARRSAELDWAVVEVSSFQLETVVEFRPQVGVLLNLCANHLNRHGSMDAYARAKARMFDRMTPAQTGIIPVTASTRLLTLTTGHPRWRTFGLSGVCAAWYENGRVVIGDGSDMIDVRGTRFDNGVMGRSAAAAALALMACGVPAGHLEAACRRFQPLPHRMQRIGEVRGIPFVDDSKATNLGAVRAALEMIDGPVRLLAGGQLKEHDLDPGQNVLERAVRGAYLFGEAASMIEKAWDGRVVCRVFGSLEEAARAAWQDAEPGDTVLLSPGCASFDQFASYAERGERFAGFVKQVEGEAT